MEDVKTALDALKVWDKGETLWSIEMGGLGPSYEQCIQFSAFEIIRVLKGKPPKGSKSEIGRRMDNALSRVDKLYKIGHSGATAGASKWLAYRFMSNGYAKTIKETPSDRKIQVDSKFGRFEKREDGIPHQT